MKMLNLNDLKKQQEINVCVTIVRFLAYLQPLGK